MAKQEELSEKEFEEAVNDFKKRLIIIELPKNTDRPFTRYVQKILDIECVLALINDDQRIITPLPDEFEAPYADMELWKIAMNNSKDRSSVNEDVSEPERNIYIVSSPCRKATLAVEGFWDDLCHTMGCMRLIVSSYLEDEENIIVASSVPDNEDMSFRAYIHNANKEDKSRKSYVYVRNVGMLSEKSLNA